MSSLPFIGMYVYGEVSDAGTNVSVQPVNIKTVNHGPRKKWLPFKGSYQQLWYRMDDDYANLNGHEWLVMIAKEGPLAYTRIHFHKWVCDHDWVLVLGDDSGTLHPFSKLAHAKHMADWVVDRQGWWCNTYCKSEQTEADLDALEEKVNEKGSRYLSMRELIEDLNGKKA